MTLELALSLNQLVFALTLPSGMGSIICSFHSTVLWKIHRESIPTATAATVDTTEKSPPIWPNRSPIEYTFLS